MAEIETLENCRVAILGLGLMGGSLALKLRGQCARLLGCDPDPATRRWRERWGWWSSSATRRQEVVTQADLVVLAAPVGAILSLLEELPDLQPGPAAVLDLGSTKARSSGACRACRSVSTRWAGTRCAGRKRAVWLNAEADLFEGATFALTPLQRTSPARAPVGRAAGRGDRRQTHLAGGRDARPLGGCHQPRALPGSQRPGGGYTAGSAPAGWPRSAQQHAPGADFLDDDADILETNRANILAGLQRFA